MLFPALLFTFGVILVAAFENPFYRRDYAYLNQFDAFYKLHMSRNGTKWDSAFFACEDEEAFLFYPKTGDEWSAVKSLLSKKPTTANVSEVLVGIHDEFGFGIFTTVDGSSFSFEIENQATIDGPACVSMDIDSGSYRTVKCDPVNLPFVCKKEYRIEHCPTVDTGYTYIKQTRKCYKFHEKMRTWRDAMQTCSLEGGSLVLIRSEAEAEIISDHLSVAEKSYFAGFRKLPPSDQLYTVRGQKLDDTFYIRWYTNDKDCGSIFKATAGLIKLYTKTTDCLEPQAFVCEMVPKIFNWRDWLNQASGTNYGQSGAEPELSVSVSVSP